MTVIITTTERFHVDARDQKLEVVIERKSGADAMLGVFAGNPPDRALVCRLNPRQLDAFFAAVANIHKAMQAQSSVVNDPQATP